MEHLIYDIYQHIAEFLDDISLLNFVMTSKNICKYTKNTRNKKINIEKFSLMKKITGLNHNKLKFAIEICYGYDIPVYNRMKLFNDCFISNKKKLPFGVSSSLVTHKPKTMNNHQSSRDKIEYLPLSESGQFPSYSLIDDLCSIKIEPEKDKIMELLVCLQLNYDKHNENYINWTDIITKKLMIKLSQDDNIFISFDDGITWEILPKNEIISKSYFINEYSNANLSFLALDKRIILTKYKVVINDNISFKKKVYNYISDTYL